MICQRYIMLNVCPCYICQTYILPWRRYYEMVMRGVSLSSASTSNSFSFPMLGYISYIICITYMFIIYTSLNTLDGHVRQPVNCILFTCTCNVSQAYYTDCPLPIYSPSLSFSPTPQFYFIPHLSPPFLGFQRHCGWDQYYVIKTMWNEGRAVRVALYFNHFSIIKTSSLHSMGVCQYKYRPSRTGPSVLSTFIRIVARHYNAILIDIF